MKARFWVVGKKSVSLRNSLNNDLGNDRELKNDEAEYPVWLKKQHKATRPRGWSKLRSRYSDGAVNYRWNTRLKILECWAVTKGRNRPFRLIGEFVETVLASQKKNVRAIHIEVE